MPRCRLGVCAAGFVVVANLLSYPSSASADPWGGPQSADMGAHPDGSYHSFCYGVAVHGPSDGVPFKRYHSHHKEHIDQWFVEQ